MGLIDGLSESVHVKGALYTNNQMEVVFFFFFVDKGDAGGVYQRGNYNGEEVDTRRGDNCGENGMNERIGEAGYGSQEDDMTKRNKGGRGEGPLSTAASWT